MAKASEPGAIAPLYAWSSVKSDPDMLRRVMQYKRELEEQVEEWGYKNGISDLSLGHVFTARNPDIEIHWFWNTKGGKDGLGAWVRYRNGDEVPRWLQALGKEARKFKHPNGVSIPPEAHAKFKGRSGESKLTSIDDFL
jgi:hypothetical protein